MRTRIFKALAVAIVAATMLTGVPYTQDCAQASEASVTLLSAIRNETGKTPDADDVILTEDPVEIDRGDTAKITSLVKKFSKANLKKNKASVKYQPLIADNAPVTVSKSGVIKAVSPAKTAIKVTYIYPKKKTVTKTVRHNGRRKKVKKTTYSKKKYKTINLLEVVSCPDENPSYNVGGTTDAVWSQKLYTDFLQDEYDIDTSDQTSDTSNDDRSSATDSRSDDQTSTDDGSDSTGANSTDTTDGTAADTDDPDADPEEAQEKTELTKWMEENGVSEDYRKGLLILNGEYGIQFIRSMPVEKIKAMAYDLINGTDTAKNILTDKEIATREKYRKAQEEKKKKKAQEKAKADAAYKQTVYYTLRAPSEDELKKAVFNDRLYGTDRLTDEEKLWVSILKKKDSNSDVQPTSDEYRWLREHNMRNMSYSYLEGRINGVIDRKYWNSQGYREIIEAINDIRAGYTNVGKYSADVRDYSGLTDQDYACLDDWFKNYGFSYSVKYMTYKMADSLIKYASKSGVTLFDNPGFVDSDLIGHKNDLITAEELQWYYKFLNYYRYELAEENAQKANQRANDAELNRISKTGRSDEDIINEAIAERKSDNYILQLYAALRDGSSEEQAKDYAEKYTQGYSETYDIANGIKRYRSWTEDEITAMCDTRAQELRDAGKVDTFVTQYIKKYKYYLYNIYTEKEARRLADEYFNGLQNGWDMIDISEAAAYVRQAHGDGVNVIQSINDDMQHDDTLKPMLVFAGFTDAEADELIANGRIDRGHVESVGNINLNKLLEEYGHPDCQYYDKVYVNP